MREPAVGRRAVAPIALEMGLARLAAGQRQHRRAALRGRPALDHRERHLGVELDAVGVLAPAEHLRVERVVVGEVDGAPRDLEGLLVPLIEHRRSLEVPGAGGGRVDRVVADLDEVLGVAADAGAEHARHHLRAEADAEQRLAARQRDALEPVELEAHARPVVVVGALRAAEHDRSGVAREVLGQRVEQVGTAPVER